MNVVLKILRFLVESGLLIKSLGKQSKVEQKSKGVHFVECY